MNLVISGKNIDITEGLRAAVEEKIGKLERYFNDSTEVHVTLSTEKNRQKIEVTVPMKGTIIRAEETSTDMYVSIDLVEEVIERQLRKYKNKLIQKEQNVAQFSSRYRQSKEIRYEADGSGRSLCTDGTSRTHVLRFPQLGNRRSKCCL